MVYFLTLDDRLRKSIEAEAGQRRLNVVTIVTTPKSAGVSSRAKMTVLIVWAARDSPEADIVAAALRTATRRKSWLPALGRNAPLASNGIILYFLVESVRDHNHQQPKQISSFPRARFP